jgi:parallel beta-helix repeat protein
VGYESNTNTIIVRPGQATTLQAVGRALGRPTALRELSPGEWLLGANLRVEKGAAIRIAGPEVRWLKLRSEPGSYAWIKVLGGRIEFSNTRVTSWDTVSDQVDEDSSDGRSFVLARDGAQMDIRDSEMSYLGYDAFESYGVAWRLAGTSGDIENSRFGYNFYGLYAYEASDLIIRGNEVDHSVRYGIDPHTRANRLVIEGNRSHHNGKHGIILAEECNNSIIRNNVVWANTLHGIVLYQRSNGNLVENNTAYENGRQGININDSAQNVIRHNVTHDNAKAGIGLGQDANNNSIAGNEVYHNPDGITLYSGASGNELWDNKVHDNARYGIQVKSEGNTIAAGNEVFSNGVGVYLDVDQPPVVSRQTNRIAGNREADVRARTR